MSIVGNIVTNNGITGIPNGFNILSIEEYLKIKDNTLPTLIIGWEETKINIPEASILRKKIKDNLYWTFSTTEKRTIFEEDLKSFIKKTYEDYVKEIKFFNIDPVIYKINTTEELITKIKNVAGGFAYLYLNKVVYIYHNSIIFSIDLEQLDFIGFDREIIISTLKESTKFFEENLEKNFKNELKYLTIKYLPYLLFRDATKNTTSSLLC
jgi:hypothetical protein